MSASLSDAQQTGSLELSYVLPIASAAPQCGALTGYLLRVSRIVDEVIVVDGSPEEVFACHAREWGPHVRHVRPDLATPNGKVAGVITGVLAARHERVVIADDDVRYRRRELQRMADILQDADVVRPQNYFEPLPWHARWDTARTLLARAFGGDWPGTLGVRRSVFASTGGYAGDVMFENLELVRTIKAAGGSEAVPLDLLVARRPPSASHFVSQRVRQAYDEQARPLKMAAELALLPGLALLMCRRKSGALLLAAAASVAAAELGRRRGSGERVFPPSSALWAPLWLSERAITSWLAVAARVRWGGISYRSHRLKRAANPQRILEARHARKRL